MKKVELWQNFEDLGMNMPLNIYSKVLFTKFKH